MSIRRKYTDRDKALAYTALMANNGVIKKTARELAIPVPTLRSWVRDWEKNGAIEVPEDIELHTLEAVQKTYVDELIEVRDMTIRRLKEVVPRSTNLNHLTHTLGTVTDKVRLLNGESTNRTELVQQVSPKEFAEEFVDYLGQAFKQAKDRINTIDAEFQEEEQSQGELPTGGS